MFATRDLTNNVNVLSEKSIISPAQLADSLPVSAEARNYVHTARKIISEIIHRKSPKLLMIVGPCSIHDMDSAKNYALQLKKLHDKYIDSMYIVMRVYFEKPRTSKGWKGFINDPDMNDSFAVEKGISLARKLLIFLADLGLPAATEVLDPVTPQYLGDLIAWAAVGARTTESQIHREMASGLSMPVGFKNGTDGNVDVAINAMKSAIDPHSFIGINESGYISVIRSKGNPDVHLVLRGGREPNYTYDCVRKIEEVVTGSGMDCNMVVDCSHGNSGKDYKMQMAVARDIGRQIRAGNNSIVGMMLESHLREGRQDIFLPKNKMEYGVSVTDACISYKDTENIIAELNDSIIESLNERFINPDIRHASKG